jgi:chitosanase
MIKTQDRMFDRAFWEPAVNSADAIGLRTPLGIASIFDTIIHSGIGSYQRLKEETIKATDGTPVTGIDEEEWVRVYLEKRLGWLRKNANPAVRPAAYRAEELLKLAEESNWDLRAPLSIRGTQIRT